MARTLICANGCGRVADLIITNTTTGDTVTLDFGCFPGWATGLMQQLLEEAERIELTEAGRDALAEAENEPAEAPAPPFPSEPEGAADDGGEDDRPSPAAESDPAVDPIGDAGLESGPGPDGEVG